MSTRNPFARFIVRRTSAIVFGIGLMSMAGFLGQPAFAQQTPPAVEAQNDSRVPPSAERRDPTDPQGELRRLLNQKEVVGGVVSAAPLPPTLELKGRVIGGGRKPLVLLSLNEKRMIFLQVGDSCLLADQSIRLVEVTPDRVIVEWSIDGGERRQLLLP